MIGLWVQAQTIKNYLYNQEPETIQCFPEKFLKPNIVNLKNVENI